MNPSPTHLLFGALALGLLGAMMGAWILSRSVRAQLAEQLQVQLRAQMEALREALPSQEQAPQRIDPAPSDALDRSVEGLQAVQTAVSSALSGVRAAVAEFAGKAQAVSERDGFLRQEMHALRQAQEQAAERIYSAAHAQAEQQAQQFQSMLEGWMQDLREAMPVPASALPATQLQNLAPDGLDTGPRIEQMQAHMATELQAQRAAIERAQQQADQTLQQALQRVPQLVQQAIQVELEFQTQQQAGRDEARTNEQRRWQVEQREQDERRAAELRALLQALAMQPGKALSVVAAPPPASTSRPVTPPFGALPVPPPVVLARPPELMHTPLPRPQPTYEIETPEPELSDEEIDALPPEIPDGRPRKRILPAPKKPSLRDL